MASKLPEEDDLDQGSVLTSDDEENGTTGTGGRKKRVRGIPGSSCEPCKKQHRGCDGKRPCNRCLRNNRGDMCKYGIAPMSTRPPRKPKTSSETVEVKANPLSSQSVGIPPALIHAQSPVLPSPLHHSSANTLLTTNSMDDEREKIHEELQSLAMVLENLNQKLQPSRPPSDNEKETPTEVHPPQLDPSFLRDALWKPPPIPSFSAIKGAVTADGKEVAEELSSNSSATRGRRRKPPHKFDSRALKGSSVGYSESELASLQFAKDLLAYFGGDCGNVSVGQHAQCVVYRDFIVYVNREFTELMRAPYESIIGRSMDDFVPEAFLQYHNHMFHRELVVSGSSTIAFESVMARLDRTCFKCVFGMSLMKNGDGKLIQKICTIYLNTVQEVEVPPGKTPVPYQDNDYARKVEYEEAPEPCKDSRLGNDEAKFPLYFAKACFEAKEIRESRLIRRRRNP